jgi:GNAT superfamily N-acetyltransferase
MEIRHVETISRTPALTLAVRGWHDLVMNGAHDGGVLVGYDHKAILAVDDDGTPVGVLTWSDQEWQNAVWVNLAFVIPERRRQGVHKAMFAALVVKARELKRPVILSGTTLDNQPSRAMMDAEGRDAYAIMTKFPVPAE